LALKIKRLFWSLILFVYTERHYLLEKKIWQLYSNVTNFLFKIFTSY
jgi:hypothetical protein